MRRGIFLIFIFTLAFSSIAFADDLPRIINVEVVNNVEGTEQPVDECFIATAAYGSKFEPSVTLLREFRDDYLLTNSAGQSFVDFYYTNSPPIAQFIADSEVLKFVVRVLLMPIVGVVYGLYNPSIILTLMSILMVYYYRRSLRSGI